MKTADEIADKWGCNTWGSDRRNTLAAMKEYAQQVINEIVNNPAWYVRDVGSDQIPHGVIDENAINELKQRIENE